MPALSSEARAIALLALAAFVSASAFRICDPMLPQLAAEFGTTTGQARAPSRPSPWPMACCRCSSVPWATAMASTAWSASPPSPARWAARAPSWPSRSICWCCAGPCRRGRGRHRAAVHGLDGSYERRQATLARFLTGTILGMSAGQLAGGLFAAVAGAGLAALVCGYLIVGLLLRQEVRRQQAGLGAGLAPARQGLSRRRGWCWRALAARGAGDRIHRGAAGVRCAGLRSVLSARALRYFADRRRRAGGGLCGGRIAIHRGGRSHPQAARRARTGGGGRAGAGRGLPVLSAGPAWCGACRRACWRASAITCCTLPCRPMPPRWCRPRAARQWPGSRPACSWGRPPAWRWPARWWTRSGRPRCSAVRP